MQFGYEGRGETYAAMKTLGFAIALLRDCDVEDAAIEGMVHEILTAPHSTGEYAIGGIVPSRERIDDRPWMATYVPIAAC